MGSWRREKRHGNVSVFESRGGNSVTQLREDSAWERDDSRDEENEENGSDGRVGKKINKGV